MAHQSLYRRYRPARFGEIIGQTHVVAALRNAVATDRVGHAYLFSGPRGTGKTSTARILAKALNCEDLAGGEPCGTCGFCVSIASGTSYELHELDAASNNKVDDIRDLISRVAIGTAGRTKVYVLDEVHMLTPGAENALLKTLEEPPGHVVFVLCTTEPHKVVQTIRSRTQHLHFALVGADLLERHVRWVSDDAGLEVSDDDVAYVLTAGDGSVRDTLSALDAVTAAGRAPDGADAVAAVLEALASSDTAAALAAADEAARGGQEPRVLGEALLVQLRNAFLASVGAPLEHLSAADRAAAGERAGRLGARAFTFAMETLGVALVGMREAPDPRVDLDLALVRLTQPDLAPSLRSLTDRLDRLERGVVPRSGAQPPAPVAESPPRQGRSPEPLPPGSAATEAPPGSAATEAPPARPPSDRQPPRGSRPSGPAMLRETLARGSSAAADASASPPSPEPPAAAASPPLPEPPAAAPAPPSPEGGPVPVPSEPAAASQLEATVDPGPAVPASPESETAPALPPPSRDEAVLAWAEKVLPALDKSARARLGVGRLLPNAEGALRLGFPTSGYLSRCDDHRGDVEAAFGRCFGRAVTVLFELDDGGRSDPPSSAAAAAALRSPLLGEVVSISSGARARPRPDREERSGVEEVQQAFPGARLVELDVS